MAYLRGIDISTYQATTPSLAGLSFVFVRSSYGDAGTDARYAQHAKDVRAAGKVLGAYHYWYSGNAAAAAAHFLAVAGGADLLAIDLEGAGNSTTAAHAQVRAMIDAIHAAGRLVGLYHSDSGYPDLGQDFDWVANWSTEPSRPWDFWQYGPVNHIDGDYYKGTEAALVDLVARSKEGPGVAIYERQSVTGTAKAASGVKVAGLALGESFTVSKTATGPWSGLFDYRLHRIGGAAGPTYALHMTSGPLAGLFVNTGGVDEVYDPVPPPPTQADLDAAKAAGYAAAKAAAEAAVQAI